jgi:hypothetical protein
VTDYGILPTEDVRPRRLQGAGRDDDFYAERPRSQSSDLDASPKAAGNRGNGGFLDLVPEQYADQFRAFKEDPEFRDSSPLNSSGNLAMRESGRSPTTSEVPQQQPLPEPAAAAAPERPARRGFWGNVGRSIGRAWGAVSGAVGAGFRRLFGGRERAAPAAPGPNLGAGAAAFEYDEGMVGNVYQGERYALPARAKGIPAEMGMLGRAANAATSGRNAGQAGLPGSAANRTSLLGDAANEASAAVAMLPQALALQRAMALGRAGGGRAKPPVPGADPHESSESALGARFDEMEDDAEDLIPRKAPEQPVVPGSEVQSRESFLREQETRRAGLPVIPKDMTDFPGADILYQPQRRRAHL